MFGVVCRGVIGTILMRDHFRFFCPREFVGTEEDNAGVLSVGGVGWFIDILKQISALSVEESLCQEDWGVVFYVGRSDRRFWVGLSSCGDQEWIAHVHHNAFFQRFGRAGKVAMEQLVSDLHDALASQPDISSVTRCSWSDLYAPLE